jgi:hypothetical protein
VILKRLSADPERLAHRAGRRLPYLCDAGFCVERIEPHDEMLSEMVNQVRTKLGVEIMAGVKKIGFAGRRFYDSQGEGLVSPVCDS